MIKFMCSLNKVYSCFNEQQEAQYIYQTINSYTSSKNILFERPPDDIKQLIPNSMYIETQLKASIPWYVLVYEVLDNPNNE